MSNITIVSVTVMTGQGADKIYIYTDLPDPCWPYGNGFSFMANAAAGQGVEWVKKHLGMEPTVIQMAAQMKFCTEEPDE